MANLLIYSAGIAQLDDENLKKKNSDIAILRSSAIGQRG